MQRHDDKKSIAVQSAKELVGTSNQLTTTAYAVMDGADVGGDTCVRLVQVFSNVMTNHINSDAYNANSIFNKVTYLDPSHSDQGMSGAGWAMMAASPATAALRLGQHYYQIYRHHEVKSPAYLRRQLKRAQRLHGVVIPEIHNELYSEELSQEDLEVELQRVETLKKRRRKAARDAALLADQEALRKKLIDEMLIKIENRKSINVDDKDKVALDPVSKFINRVNDSLFVGVVNKVWQVLNTQSYIFWVIAFPVGLALGAAATLAMPYVLLAVTAIGGALLAYEVIEKTRAKKPASQAPIKKEEVDHKKAIALADAQIQQRLFISKEHDLIMRKLRNYNAQLDLHSVQEDQDACEVVNDEIYHQPNFTDVMRSSLAQRLLGSKAERRAALAVAVASRAISGFVATAFVLWVASTFVGMLPAMAVIGTFLGGAVATVGFGGAVAGLLGISTFAAVRKQQKSEEERVYEILSSQYKKEGISYLDKFTRLEADVENKKAAIKVLRDEIRQLDPQAELDNYDLKHADVHNDYYFEKQQHKPSFSTYVKKGLNRVYTLLGGGQTGVFVARCLFLVGGLAAGAVLASGFGAPFVFLGIALAVGITVGVLKLAQYQLERNQKHRHHFAETIDSRIDFLAKKKQELSFVERILTQKKAQVQAQRVRVPTTPRSQSVPNFNALNALNVLTVAPAASDQKGVLTEVSASYVDVEVHPPGAVSRPGTVPMPREKSKDALWQRPPSQTASSPVASAVAGHDGKNNRSSRPK